MIIVKGSPPQSPLSTPVRRNSRAGSSLFSGGGLSPGFGPRVASKSANSTSAASSSAAELGTGKQKASMITRRSGETGVMTGAMVVTTGGSVVAATVVVTSTVVAGATVEVVVGAGEFDGPSSPPSRSTRMRMVMMTSTAITTGRQPTFVRRRQSSPHGNHGGNGGRQPCLQGQVGGHGHAPRRQACRPSGQPHSRG